MTSGDMKNRSKKTEQYPRISIRVDRTLLDRIEAVRQPTKMSHGQMYAQAMRRYLPELEKFTAKIEPENGK